MHEAFQALWVEISFVDHKNIVCGGKIYCQHNSPDNFLAYFDRTILLSPMLYVCTVRTIMLGWGSIPQQVWCVGTPLFELNRL